MSDVKMLATHVITLQHSGGRTDRIFVIAAESPEASWPSPQPLYTTDEWDAAASADWEITEEGELRWQGRVAPYNHCTVSLSPVMSRVSR